MTVARAALPPLAHQRGFSLFELLIVMVLVVLMFTVAGVSVTRSLEAAEIRNAAREMTAALRYTRGLAITQRQQQVFLVDANAKTWQAPGRNAVALPEGLDVTLTTARSELTGNNAGGIRFYPDGASTGGRVVLSRDGREWHITVGWLTGEISRDRERER